jgi:hypothetical protein
MVRDGDNIDEFWTSAETFDILSTMMVGAAVIHG